MALSVTPSSFTPMQFHCCASVQKCFKKITDFVLKIIRKTGEFLFGTNRSIPQPKPIIPTSPVIPAIPASRALNIIQFYRGLEANNQGMTLSQILNADDNWLEARHDWVQWAFPTTEIGTLPSAPLLDRETMEIFRKDPELRANLRKVFLRTLQFYGLQMQADGKITRGPNFTQRSANWMTPANHNYLRITRIINSLGFLLGPPHAEARAFFDIMQDIYRNEGKGIIPDKSFQFWTTARNNL